MKLSIRVRDVDTELMLRMLEIGFREVRIQTPERTTSKILYPQGIINEIYHVIGPDRIQTIQSDTSEEAAYNRKLSNERMDGAVNLAFLSYDGTNVPSGKDMATLADIQYAHSEAAIVPLCPNLIGSNIGDDLLEKFATYIQRYIGIVKTLNNKTILGVIPAKIPRLFIPDILDLYLKQDVMSFVIDSDGTSIYTNLSWLRGLQRELYMRNISEEGFLYNINSNQGKFLKNADQVLAKDFITLPFGIDILGSNHIKPKLPTETWARLAAERPRSVRLFDAGTYAYVKSGDPKTTYDIAKVHNIKRQQGETARLRQVISEDGTAVRHLKGKRLVAAENVLEDVAKFKQEVKEKKVVHKSLFDA
jgi:hypothetical protein